MVCKKKMSSSAEMMCRNLSPAFEKFTEAVLNLRFDEEPNYGAYLAMFEPLVNGIERPVAIDGARKVSGGALAQYTSVLLQPRFIAGC